MAAAREASWLQQGCGRGSAEFNPQPQYYRINNIMSGAPRLTLLLFLLVAASQNHNGPNQYEITPIIPPTAFVGQYYTVNFRVNGLAKPDISFDNLPDCLTALSTGTIEGVPDTVGSYNIVLRYQSGAESGQQDIVLRVAKSTFSLASEAKSTDRQTVGWVQSVPSLYQVGDKIQLNLNKYVNNSKYTWSFLQLPEQLEASSQGLLSGIFYAEGYYSFGATCSDDRGNSFDSFFTFNIQPVNYLSAARRVYLEVPNRNVIRYNYSQIEALQNEANFNVDRARKALSLASAELGRVKASIETTESDLEMSKVQVEAVEKVVALAVKERAKQFAATSLLEDRLDKAKGAYAIKRSAYDQAAKVTSYIQKIMDTVSSLFAKMTEILKALNQKFIDAQNESTQAAADYVSAKKAVASANEDVTNTFHNVLSAKKFLQAAQNNKSAIDFDVSTASDAKDVAVFQNDAATTAYNTATSNLLKAKQNLQAANSTIFELLREKEEAKNSLGEAEFNLVQAMNTLYVAQAAKAQSDKALLLASVQSSILPSGASTYIFSGCDIGNYPSISGSASITRTAKGSYVLSSGYTLLYGNCTEAAAQPAEGDFVEFTGFVKDGLIHGLRIAKS